MNVSSLRISKLQIIILLILLIGIAAGVYLVQIQHIFKSKAANNSNLTIGFDVTGLAHYGYGDLFPNSSIRDVDTTLAEIQRLGGKVIRIYVANKHISDQEVANRLDNLLSKAEPYGISLIVSFINYYESTGNNPPSMDQDYACPNNPESEAEGINTWCKKAGIKLLTGEFFAGGYKTSYIPFITTVINQNKRHSNIYAWELGNEIQAPNGANMVAFAKDVSQRIKDLDPSHKVSTGFLNARHATNGEYSASQLYPPLKDVDVISVVDYNRDPKQNPPGLEDIQWAASNNKIPVIAEEGFNNQNGDQTNNGFTRARQYSDAMDYWENQGAQALLIWAFIAKGNSDNGNGDFNLGMDYNLTCTRKDCPKGVWHTDYDSIAGMLMARTLGNTTSDTAKPDSDLSLIKFDISNNRDFSENNGGKVMTFANPSQSQSIAWNESSFYVREFQGKNNSVQNTDIYSVTLNNKEAILIGSVLIEYVPN